MDRDLEKLRPSVEQIRRLSGDGQGGLEWLEAATLAQTVLHDSVGGSHPLNATIRSALDKTDHSVARAAARALVTAFDQGRLVSSRLLIAHELESNLLDLAQAQVSEAEKAGDGPTKTLRLAISAFLAGAALEDALRRLCDANQLRYDPQRSSLSKLQSALYQPSNQIEVITSSENKQITAWGDTRNNADHGKFADLGFADVLSMVIGVRGFIDKHLP